MLNNTLFLTSFAFLLDSPRLIHSRWQVADIILLIAVQAILIGTLFVFYRKKRAAEKAQLESEEIHRCILQNIIDPVFITDKKGEFTFVSLNAMHRLGFTEQEILALGNISKLLGENIFDQQELERNGEILDIERIIQNKNGQELTFLVTVKNVVIRNGILLYTCHDITDRKQAEGKMLLHKKILNKSEEIAHLGSWHLDIKKNILTWSDENYRIFGHAPQTFGATYDTFLDAVHPDDRDMVDRTYTYAINNKTPYECVHRIVRPNGEVRVVWERSEDIVDENGESIHSFGLTQDITERRRKEEELVESEKKFRALFEQAGGYCMILDPDTPDGIPLIVDANEAACLMHGYKREEFIDRSVADIDDEDGKRLVKDRTIEIMTGKPFYIENVHVRKDGTTFPVAVNAQRIDIGDIGDRKTVILTTEYDITERKKAEIKLLESERRYRNLLESTSTVPWELDLECGFFTYMGHQIEKILGYPAASWTDLDVWAERLHPDDREEAVHFCVVETQKGNDHDFVYRALHKDGSHRWIRDIVSVVMGEKGPERLVGFMHDITEAKELAAEKEKLEERWLQAQKLEVVGTLAGGITHDFNNILCIILGYAALAKGDAPPGSDFSRDLKEIITAGNRAKDLVEQILTFSRKVRVDKKVIDPRPLIKETLKMLRATLPATIAIQEDLALDCETMYADPTQIHQIVLNLCTNAFHVMEETGGLLTVKLKRADIIPDELHKEGQETEEAEEVEENEFIELTVSDSGSGIAPAIIDNIFDPFFITKELDKGTGMGLATTYGIVKDCGGAITVDSLPGQGATFRLYFPLCRQPSIFEDLKEGNSPGGNEKILFVDDEESLGGLWKIILEGLGYHVTVYQSGLDALAAFEESPADYDIVITDQTMPGMTGFDFACQMLAVRPNLPIILCTGYSSTVDLLKARAMGIKDFTLKPLTKGVISNLIRKVLDEKED